MVTIAVLTIADCLIANNDEESGGEDTPLSIPAPGVLTNDSGTVIPNLTATLVSGPRHALSFTLNTDGSYAYTSVQDFNGVDTFTYRITDGARVSNVAMVNIDVVAINDVPQTSSRSVTTNEDTPVTITLNATDVDSKTLNFTVGTFPSRGSLGLMSGSSCTIIDHGSSCTATVTYTPFLNVFGADSFTFSVSDGQLTTPASTVSITVAPVNDLPGANAGGPYAAKVGTPVQFNGSGSDPDGDPLIFSWNFGDGTNAVGPSPVKAYTAPGTYSVSLSVSDPFGGIGTAQTVAAIEPGGLTLNPIGNKNVSLGETLNF